MRKFVSCFGHAAIAFIVLTCVQAASAQSLRYTVTATLPGIVWGTAPTNCATNNCVITVTAVGNASTAASFGYTCITAPCTVIGMGSDGYWNRSLTNMTVTVYDPISGVTYGPATFPPSFFTAFDNFNGGIGFGSLGYGGPAYPVSVYVNSGGFAYSPAGIFVFYDLMYPELVGGTLLNCPTIGTTPPCATTSPLPIPVTLGDGSVVQLSVPSTQPTSPRAQYWVQEEPAPHQWTAVAPTIEARSGHTATLLSNGKVLVVGGAAGTKAATMPEIYDPIADSWAAAPTPACGRRAHTATLLGDGRVLVVGGTQCPTTAEIFDAVAGTWSTAAAIPVSFPGPTTTVRLRDNRVLVAGANGGEIYDPVLNLWSAVPPPPTPFSQPVGSLLPNGSVVLVDNSICETTQIFTPVTATWTTGSPSIFCSYANLTATTLNTGDVLVYGVGYFPSAFWSLYQPATNMWGGTQPPSTTFNTYDDHTLPIGENAVAQTLSDGRVMLVGGSAAVGLHGLGSPLTVPLPAPISPLFYPTGFAVSQPYGLWLPEPALTIGRTGHATVTLQNGDVLAIGGQSLGSAPSALSSVERLNMGTLPRAVAPVFSLAGGTYNTPQTLTLYQNNPNETFYYTYDGSAPTTSSTLYTGSIAINASEVVEAIATEPYHAPSKISSKAYVIQSLSPAAAPFFNLAGGTYHSPQLLTLTDSTPGAVIHYTTNGTAPTASSTVYTGPITIASTETVEAAAIAAGYSLSPASAKSYVYVPYTPAAAPSFSLAGGTYNTPQKLTLTDTTAGATIYYTTNGAAPTTASTVYSGPITIASTETVKAAAIATGYSLSPVSAKAYTYVSLPLAAPPYFSLAGGHYTTPQMLTLNDTTPGATIYYTTNGTIPTMASTKYTGPITISTTETVIAIAAASGYTASNPAAKAYTIP